MKNKLEYSLILLCSLLPLLILTTYRGGSVTFYAIIVFSLAVLYQHAASSSKTVFSDYKGLWLACSVPTIAVLVSAIGHARWPGTDFEAAIRFSIALPLLVTVLVPINREYLKLCLWGVFLAALAGACYTIWLSLPDFKMADTEFLIRVSYGSILAMLAAICIFSLSIRLTPWQRAEQLLKLILASLAFLGFALAQSRTGWLAVPLFILLGIVLFARFKSPWKTAIWFLGILAVIIAVGASNPISRDRIQRGYDETMQCAGHVNTIDNSICARFQMWRAAWSMFTQDPILGSGKGSDFADRLTSEFLPAGIVSKLVAENFGEPHNDLLHKLASFGILGGLGLLLMYFAPTWVFIKRLHVRHPAEIRATAAMGAAVCLGFACFGLTEMMFRNMRVIGLYTVLIALFMALSDPRQSSNS